jgi:tRNA A-37 threonylcarbamoyl transferase component Bud32
MQIPAGTIIDDRFRIMSPLGSGAMGAVFEAYQKELDRTVAIKFLNDPAADEVESFARFQREGQVLSQLRHKHVVSVYAFGRWRGIPYMVLEKVVGISLQELLRANEPLDPEFIIDSMVQVCLGLQAAHNVGIVHRDIKPSNLLVTDSLIKIIDFGLAKQLKSNTAAGQELTEAGTTIGTVLYMSPEQCNGEPVDARSDIYSLGCVIHHCVTGEPPFTGEHSLVVMLQHMRDPLPRCGNELLQVIIDNATAKEPANRYQTADEMREDLLAARRGEKVHPRALVSATKPSAARLSERRPSRKLLVGALLLAGIACGAITVAAWHTTTSLPTTVESPAVAVQNEIRGLPPGQQRADKLVEACELEMQLAKTDPQFAGAAKRAAQTYAFAALADADPDKLKAIMERVKSAADSREISIVLYERAMKALQAKDISTARYILADVALPYAESSQSVPLQQRIWLVCGLLRCDHASNDRTTAKIDAHKALDIIAQVKQLDLETARRITLLTMDLMDLGLVEERFDVDAFRAKLLLSGPDCEPKEIALQCVGAGASCSERKQTDKVIQLMKVAWPNALKSKDLDCIVEINHAELCWKTPNCLDHNVETLRLIDASSSSAKLDLRAKAKYWHAQYLHSLAQNKEVIAITDELKSPNLAIAADIDVLRGESYLDLQELQKAKECCSRASKLMAEKPERYRDSVVAVRVLEARIAKDEHRYADMCRSFKAAMDYAQNSKLVMPSVREWLKKEAPNYQAGTKEPERFLCLSAIDTK